MGLYDRRRADLGIVKRWIYGFAALACSAIGVFWSSQRLIEITYETIELSSLPEELDGLRILHISDIHARSPEKIGLNIWKRAFELDFDVVAITGDIVDRNAYQIEPHLPYIEALTKDYPVFFCEGNHDHYSISKLRQFLEGAGVTVLVDESSEFSMNGTTTEVTGLSDYYTADIHAQSGLFGSVSDVFSIVLVHQPQHAELLPVKEGSLVLSGHTHGGQWRLPFLPTIYAPGQGFFPKYGHGQYDINGSKLFVSKGISSTGKAPFRIWNRPEICVITLERGRADG